MILKRKLFSEKKLSTSDKINLASVKLIPRKESEDYSEYWDMEDEEKSKAAAKRIRRRDNKRLAAISTAMGTVGGAIAGKNLKSAAIGTGIGAAGGAIFAGANHLGSKSGEALARKLYKKNEKYRENAKKGSDQYKVGAKKMTKEEYTEKYGKEK